MKQMTDDRRQKTENGRQKTENGKRKTEGNWSVLCRLCSVVCPLAFAGGLISVQAPGAANSRTPGEHADTYALIVSGINKEPADRLAKDTIVGNLRTFLLDKVKVKPEQQSVLVGPSSSVRQGSKISTADNVKETLAGFVSRIRPADRFIFYYAGQANTVDGKLRLNLPGEDITHQQLAEWMGPIEASSMLLVLDCPGAGLAVKALTGKGRLIVCSCKADQHYSTKFGEYFVPALSAADSDADSDGKVSILEAFTSASRQLEDWYRQQSLLQTETAVLEDNGDGEPSAQPWRYERDGGDGLRASKFFLAAK